MFHTLFETLSALPVHGIAAEVTTRVLAGTVSVVASATGSGKTLLLPANLAMETEKVVYVLVPRRFLAVNAAETVAELSGTTVGQEVGFAIGAQSGEDSQRSMNTRVLYCTYGYALASGIINTAENLVFDEIHEASLDMSICRALVHRRLASGERVNVLEMSATIDAERQAAYWRSVSKVEVTEIDGRTFPCERRHLPAQTPEAAVLDLIADGRTGILVFRPGRGEVEDTAAAIRALVGEEVEVAEIYGELDYRARKAAVATPKGKVKVLVGTNVVESGANITWLDAGVSCGTAKELSVRPETGATYLALIQLPRWRLDQQEGRVKRFRAGVFVLCSPLSYEKRPAETTPEIKRLALTELVMHCASFGIRAEELVFDYAPERSRIVDAETKLQRLGLIDTQCRLTKAGEFVSDIPVGPETGAMLWHAKEIGVLGAALPLAAVIEVDGVRKDFKHSHHINGTSDWLDACKAFETVYEEREYFVRKDLMERYNVGFKRFEAAKDMLHDLKRRFNGKATATTEATDSQLKQCLVAGFITNLFQGTYRLTPISGDRYFDYSAGEGSSVMLHSGFALGQLRTIVPKNRMKSPFTIVEKLTDVSLNDILALVKIRPTLVEMTERREEVGRYRFETVTRRKLFGLYDLPVERRESPLTDEENEKKETYEQTRYLLRQRLSKLDKTRESMGLPTVWLELDYFRLGFVSGQYAYTETDVTRAEQDTQYTILQLRSRETSVVSQESYSNTLARILGEEAKPAPQPAPVPVQRLVDVSSGIAALKDRFNRR